MPRIAVKQVRNLVGASLVAASVGIKTVEAILKTLSIPANTLDDGNVFFINISGTCTSTVANLATFTVRYGANGTTADTSMGILTCTAAAAGANIPFSVRLMVIFRTTGGTGTVKTDGTLINNGVTGISAASVVAASPAVVGSVSTTGAKFISVSAKTAATTTTIAIEQCVITRAPL